MSATTTRFGSGQAVQRLEDDQLLKGEGVYAADVVPEGQTRLCFVRSPYAHARLVSVDTSEAEKIPGVRLVLSGPALAAKGVKPMPRAMNFTRADGSPLAAADRRVLAADRVRYVGEAVAAVVADTEQQARDAAEMVRVEYDELPCVVTLADALAAFAVVVSDRQKGDKLSLDARTKKEGADCKLAAVHEGGAAHRAGLSAGDVLVAIDGLRVTASNLDTLLQRYRRGDVVADRSDGEAFLDRDAAVGLHHRSQHRVIVDGAQRPQVDDLGADPVLGQFLGRLQGIGHADAEADDGHIRALPPDRGLAEGDGEIFHHRNFERPPVEDFVLKEDHRVRIADRRLQRRVRRHRIAVQRERAETFAELLLQFGRQQVRVFHRIQLHEAGSIRHMVSGQRAHIGADDVLGYRHVMLTSIAARPSAHAPAGLRHTRVRPRPCPASVRRLR